MKLDLKCDAIDGKEEKVEEENEEMNIGKEQMNEQFEDKRHCIIIKIEGEANCKLNELFIFAQLFFACYFFF